VSVRRGGPLEVFLGDVVRLRKPHPCGSFDWTVVRLGADIGLRCHGCARKVLLPRRELERRLKTFVSRGPEFAAGPDEPESDAAHVPADGAAGAGEIVRS
jgi:hypothetical protein